jgi:hypothetical protein
MKKFKNLISVLLAVVLMTTAFCIPALAVVSQYDSSYLSSKQQSQIQAYTYIWEYANSTGNTALATAAHNAAEAVRATASYSGGTDGSEYIPLNNGSSSSSGSGYSGYYNYTTYYTITASAGTGGSISPSGSSSVASGNSKTYTITANSGYKISDVTIDGASVGALSTYTFSNVKKAHTIKATFAVDSYTITASAGTGGSINPSGSTSVNSGSSKTFTITASSGYKIADVKVDGSSVGARSSYTFSNVTAAHTISVTFASAASLSAGSATLGDDGSGTLTNGTTKSGYGFTASLPVSASYVSGMTVTASYNFTSSKTVSLEYVNGTWQFPVNSASATGARKVYISVETPDGTYTITFTVRALDPQATALTGSNVYLTSTKSITITVKGDMYQDDFTGNS